MTSHDRQPERHDLSSNDRFPMMASKFDLLSQMLTLIRLRGELVFSSELAAPWTLTFEPGPSYFHVVMDGDLWVEVPGQEPLQATSGDLLMIPHGAGHTLRMGDAAAVPVADILKEQAQQGELAIRFGGNGARTNLVSGAFRFEGENMPSMMAAMPALIHIPRDKRTDEVGWLEGLAYYLLLEARASHAGAALMISRLIDIVIIRTLRSWVQIAPTGSVGWLGALVDRRIGRALAALHEAPFRTWSVSGLAEIAAMSRSSFAERFTTLVGEPPLQYQTHWRLALAKDMLENTELRVKDAARRVGYESEAAFSRAFKARFGVAPKSAKHRVRQDAETGPGAPAL